MSISSGWVVLQVGIVILHSSGSPHRAQFWALNNVASNSGVDCLSCWWQSDSYLAKAVAPASCEYFNRFISDGIVLFWAARPSFLGSCAKWGCFRPLLIWHHLWAPRIWIPHPVPMAAQTCCSQSSALCSYSEPLHLETGTHPQPTTCTHPPAKTQKCVFQEQENWITILKGPCGIGKQTN